MKISLNAWFPEKVKVSEAIKTAFCLFQARGFSAPKLDAEVLLASLLGLEKIDLYTDCMRELNEEERTSFAEFVERRLANEPVAQITGKKEFWSLDFRVNRDCLIPRPETELLVEKALEIYSSRSIVPSDLFRIFELGTGSGIIAVCLAREIVNAAVIATDISHHALAVAEENAQRHGVSGMIKFLQGNLFAPVGGEKSCFDLIISNPPYIAGKDFGTLSREIVEYEPYEALYGGDDGLNFYRLIIPESLSYLREQGSILLEVGFGEAGQVVKMLKDTEGFEDIAIKKDFAGIPRVVSARKNSLV